MTIALAKSTMPSAVSALSTLLLVLVGAGESACEGSQDMFVVVVIIWRGKRARVDGSMDGRWESTVARDEEAVGRWANGKQETNAPIYPNLPRPHPAQRSESKRTHARTHPPNPTYHAPSTTHRVPHTMHTPHPTHHTPAPLRCADDRTTIHDPRTAAEGGVGSVYLHLGYQSVRFALNLIPINTARERLTQSSLTIFVYATCRYSLHLTHHPCISQLCLQTT